MGGRMLKRWMVLPLKDLRPIQDRLDAVQALLSDKESSFALGERLKDISDLERIISKVAVGKINPREILQLKRTLLQLKPIKELIGGMKSEVLAKIG